MTKLFNLFPTPVYKFSLTGHKTYKEKLIKPIIKKYKDNPDSTFDWARNCNTWQIDAHAINTNLNDVYDEIMKGCTEYLEELKASGNFGIMDSWFNVHTSDMYQELHDHLPAFISGTYYIKFDKEKDSPLTFVSNNTQFTDVARVMNVPLGLSEWMQLDVNEGDVLLFPSTLRHMVIKAKVPHNNLRITNSFNIRPFIPNRTHDD